MRFLFFGAGGGVVETGAEGGVSRSSRGSAVVRSSMVESHTGISVPLNVTLRIQQVRRLCPGSPQRLQVTVLVRVAIVFSS